MKSLEHQLQPWPKLHLPCTHWLLITDGSGAIDGFGGYVAAAYPQGIDSEPYIVLGGGTHTSVERQELLALLEGLETMFVADPFISKQFNRVVVDWYCDRIDIVKAVKGEVKHSAVTEDLVMRLAYYQRFFEIRANWEDKNNKRPQHQFVDQQTKKLRALIKNAYNDATINYRQLVETLESRRAITPGSGESTAALGADSGSISNNS